MTHRSIHLIPAIVATAALAWFLACLPMLHLAGVAAFAITFATMPVATIVSSGAAWIRAKEATR